MNADNEYKQSMAQKLHERILTERTYIYGGIGGGVITYILTLNNTWFGIIPTAIILIFGMLRLKKIEADIKYLKETYLNNISKNNSEAIL